MNLGKVVIVTNLGVDLLIGELGKVDNKIVNIPHKKLIKTENIKGKVVQIPYSLKKGGLWLNVCSLQSS